MKPRIYSAAVCAALFAVAAAAYAGLEARHESGVFAVDPPTPYVHYSPAGAPRGRVLVAHGLNSNKGVMNLFSMALADAGFEVYAIDLPGHGDSRAHFDGLRARQALAESLDALDAGSDGVTVVGHSLGAALILDLANEREFGEVVLLSPAPTPVGRVKARRVLVFAGDFDIPRVSEFARQLEGEATLDHPVEFRTMVSTGHTGGAFRPAIHRQIATWLGGNAPAIQTGKRLALLLAMGVLSVALGIALVPGNCGEVDRGEFGDRPQLRDRYPALANNGPRAIGVCPRIPPDQPHRNSQESFSLAIARYAAAGAAAVLIMAAVPSLFSWLGLFGGDYLIGLLLLMGSALLLMRGRSPLGIAGFPALQATLAAAYVIAVPALWVGGNLLHMAWSGGRWWRLPVFAVGLLPFFLADEIFIRPIVPRWKAIAAALLTRLSTVAFYVTGALTFNREASALFLIAVPIVALWVGLWLAGAVVRRHTRSPFAAALFAALVQAAILSAVFVIG